MSYEKSFAALSDPTRRVIFERLAQNPGPVGLLAKGLPVSRPAVSQHLKVLTDAGLVSCYSKGTRNIYSVRRQGLAELRAYLDRFWDDVLTGFVEEASKKDH